MILDSIIGLVILMFSAILHEVAHGFVADRLGDPTARIANRLTLDPRSHIDPIGTILLPLLMIFSGGGIVFGWAKPVPVDPFNLREGRKDMALVALSGPLTNILLATVASIIIHLLQISGVTAEFLLHIFIIIVIYNLSLAVFNLFPIPPLDGSKVFSLLLPERDANRYLSLGQFGFFIIILLLYLPGSPLQQLIGGILAFSLRLLGLEGIV